MPDSVSVNLTTSISHVWFFEKKTNTANASSQCRPKFDCSTALCNIYNVKTEPDEIDPRMYKDPLITNDLLLYQFTLSDSEKQY